MTTLVYYNGVLLTEAADYRLTPGGIVQFGTAPPKGDTITVQTGSYMHQFIGNGATTQFQTDKETSDALQITKLIYNITEYRDHPLVRDALDRLKVALALVKD